MQEDFRLARLLSTSIERLPSVMFFLLVSEEDLGFRKACTDTSRKERNPACKPEESAPTMGIVRDQSLVDSDE